MNQGDLKYCPRCAGPLAWRDAGHPPSRQPVCVECGFVLWQNLKPSVEALIVRGARDATQVLLGRRGELGGGKDVWDIPGGFLNADDGIHEALRRECLREVGVEVDVGDLAGVFEDDFAGSRIISIVYICRIVRGEPRAADIVDDVRWFGIDEMPEPAFAAVGEALAALKDMVKRRP